MVPIALLQYILYPHLYLIDFCARSDLDFSRISLEISDILLSHINSQICMPCHVKCDLKLEVFYCIIFP